MREVPRGYARRLIGILVTTWSRPPTHLNELRIFHERALQIGADQVVVVFDDIQISWHKIVLRETKVVCPPVLESLPAPKESRVQENLLQRTRPFKTAETWRT